MSGLLFFGRLLFGGFFLFSGINHFVQSESLARYAASSGVPWPELSVLATGAMLVAGGFSVLAGFAPRIGLALIAAFLVPVTLMMHPFWDASTAQQKALEMTQFMKNVALLGATFGLMALPLPWRMSVDETLRTRWPKWTRFTGFGSGLAAT